PTRQSSDLLKNAADALWNVAVDRFALEDHLAGSRSREARKDVEQGGFSAARGPYDRIELALLEDHVDRTECMQARLVIQCRINARNASHLGMDFAWHGSVRIKGLDRCHFTKLSSTTSLHFTGPSTSPMIWRPFTMLSMPSYS